MNWFTGIDFRWLLGLPLPCFQPAQFLKTNIQQNNVATRLSFGGIICDRCIANYLLSMSVKVWKMWKKWKIGQYLANIWTVVWRFVFFWLTVYLQRAYGSRRRLESSDNDTCNRPLSTNGRRLQSFTSARAIACQCTVIASCLNVITLQQSTAFDRCVFASQSADRCNDGCCQYM